MKNQNSSPTKPVLVASLVSRKTPRMTDRCNFLCEQIVSSKFVSETLQPCSFLKQIPLTEPRELSG